MKEQLLSGLSDTLRRDGILLSFGGPFSQGMIEEIGSALQSYLAVAHNPPARNSSVFSVFIEQTQNIRNYIKKNRIDEFSDPGHGFGIVVIGSEDDHIFISSGNLIFSRDVPSLCERIEAVNSLDREELVARYKTVLREKHDKETGGAGLGFMEMARRASRPLEYSSRKVDGEYDFFTLNVVI